MRPPRPPQMMRQGTTAPRGQRYDFHRMEMMACAPTDPNYKAHRRLALQNAPPKVIFRLFMIGLKRKQAKRHLLKNFKALIIKAMLDMMKDKLIKSLLLGGRKDTSHGRTLNQLVNCSRGPMSPLGRVRRY